MSKLIALTTAQVSIETDPEYGYETGIVTFNGQQPAIIDTMDTTFSNFDEETNEAFEKKIYEEGGMQVSEVASLFGCKYRYIHKTDEMNEVDYYFKQSHP